LDTGEQLIFRKMASQDKYGLEQEELRIGRCPAHVDGANWMEKMWQSVQIKRQRKIGLYFPKIGYFHLHHTFIFRLFEFEFQKF